VYQPLLDRGIEELSTGGENGEEEVMAATITDLPCALWEGLWDSLVYEDNIKNKLLNYIYSTLLLSDAGVDCEFMGCVITSTDNFPPLDNIVSWNRSVHLLTIDITLKHNLKCCLIAWAVSFPNYFPVLFATFAFVAQGPERRAFAGRLLRNLAYD
jgi:hypothetical protein